MRLTVPVPVAPESALSADDAAAAYWAAGFAPLDATLGGGFARGRVHEFYAADIDDASATAAFAAAVALGMAAAAGNVLILRSRRAVRGTGVLQGAGWTDLGGAADRALFGVVADDMALLRAGVDAMRSGALAAVIVESWGASAALDLTASRRLALTAEKSGVPMLLVRVDAAPVPSAAQTRWRVAAAPSRALPGNAPGQPVFAIELLRQRGGPAGLDWTLEWDRDRRTFRACHEAALSGAAASALARRTLAAGTQTMPDPGACAAA
jgi:protein ImuA